MKKALFFLFAVGLAYVGGRLHERWGTEDLAERVMSLTSQLEQLKARQYLDDSLSALDQRNFGIAQQRLKQAASTLLAIESQSEKLSELAEAIQQVKVVAAGDIGSQIGTVRKLARQFDRIKPGASESGSQESVPQE